MKQQIRTRWVVATLFIVGSFTFGCITPTQRGPALPETPPAAHSVSSQDIESKIADLNQMLASDELDDNQREMAVNLLSLYEKLRQEQMDCTETLKLVLGHLNDLEGIFSKGKNEDDSVRRHIIQQFSKKQALILDDYIYGNYQGVIDGIVELETSFGVDALTPEIGLVFAVSLAKKGLLEEALEIASKILVKMEGKPDIIHLRASMIDWQLGMGKRDNALKVYEKLLDSLDERNGLLRKSQRSLALKTDVPTPRPDIPATEGSGFGEKDAEIVSIDQLIGEVERLIVDDEYRQAKILIVRRRLKTQDDAEIVLLDQAYQRVEEAESAFRNRTQGGLPEEDPLKTAKTLIDAEKFERAVETIDAIGANEILSPEARKLKALAIEGLINRERNRAAKLFLMAKNAQDPLRKKECLVSSHIILKSLVEKFPLSPLNSKIKTNMDTVENEMRNLGIIPE